MRRLFALLTGLCLTLAGCNDAYDDSELVKRMDDFEQRLAKLERLCNDMNTNLGSMQTIVTALDNGDYITSVEPLTENGAVVGYTLKFAKGKPIVIYNGKSGTAPVIAVRKDADGIYYWTLDGEWLTGDDGKKLPVSGDAVAPKLRIEEDYWYISYDDGATWTQLGKASGEDGKDAAGIEIDMDENYVYFTLPGGQTVTVPRVGGGDTPAPAVPHILYAAGQEAGARERLLLRHDLARRQALSAERRLGRRLLQRGLHRGARRLRSRLRGHRRSGRRPAITSLTIRTSPSSGTSRPATRRTPSARRSAAANTPPRPSPSQRATATSTPPDSNRPPSTVAPCGGRTARWNICPTARPMHGPTASWPTATTCTWEATCSPPTTNGAASHASGKTARHRI